MEEKKEKKGEDIIEINPDFEAQAKKIGDDIAKKDGGFVVVSHHDADGITACAITVDFLRNFLKKDDIDFIVMKQLDSVTIGKIKDKKGGGNKTLIFTDMGSGQLSLLEEHGFTDFFIADHHVPEREDPRQLNPSFYGYDGGSDISGAGVAYMIARTAGYKKMAHIAIVGAVGDMQDSEGRLESLNRIIAQDAVDEGTLVVEHDIRLFGRQSRALVQMLAYASNPIIPGLCGDEEAAKSFLQTLGIDPSNSDNSRKHYIDLTEEDKKKLISGIYMHLLDRNIPEYIIQGIVGEVYTLVKEEERTELRDSKEFATLLNACGRQEQPEIGVHVCLGEDRENYGAQARKLLERHRKTLREGITCLKKEGVEEKDYLYFFDATGKISESIVGVIAGMGYSAQVFGPNKPILALAEDNDDETMLKVSARGNWSLIRKGIHLGNAMRDGSRAFGGEGGGHDIAAGARIPKVKKEEFLDKINSIFRQQLKK